MTIGTYFKTIWRNRRHFKMQIFGVTVLAVVMVFVINLISIRASYNKQVQNYLASTTKYVSSFQMSLSGITGTVDYIFVSEDKTKCFVMMTLADTSMLAMDAGNYQVFVTNCNRDGSKAGVPKENITGEIYMFGSTGIVGIYLRSDIPWENQMKHLIFRSYTKFTSNTDPYVKTMSDDYDYDQGHIYLNPGASDSTTIDFLENHDDSESFSLTQIYRQTKSVANEDEIRSNCLQFYADLQANVNQIGEYQSRLVDIYGVELPAISRYITDDSFENINIYDIDGNVIDTYERYIPNTIVPGGTEYDWYKGNLTRGISYYDLIPGTKDMTIREYLNELSSDASERSIDKISTKEWYYADGTAVKLTGKDDMTSMEKEISDAIDEYEKLLNKYVDLKKTYQATYLRSFLELELNTDFSAYTYAVRNDENTVLKY